MSPIDSKDRELLEYLHRHGGADVQEICDLLKVTRNAVRQRISRLEGCGLLEGSQRSQERGRPRNVYQVTADGLHSLGEDYRELAVVFWEAIVGLDEADVRERLISQVRDRLTERFRHKLTNLIAMTEQARRPQ